jgi:hypothetical protein
MMSAAFDVLVIALCVWAAIVGTLIGAGIWKWFWSDDDGQ